MNLSEFTVKLKANLKGVFISRLDDELVITAPDCGYQAAYYDHDLDRLEDVYRAVVEAITARRDILANYTTNAKM